MGLAFEMVRVALKLEDRPDINVAMVASKIIAVAEGGELDPHRLCERVLADLGPYSPRE
jgi:hypothetical protein